MIRPMSKDPMEGEALLGIIGALTSDGSRIYIPGSLAKAGYNPKRVLFYVMDSSCASSWASTMWPFYHVMGPVHVGSKLLAGI